MVSGARSRPRRASGFHSSIAATLASALAVIASAQVVVYSDDFDIDTSANWTTISSGDSSVEFAFDYSTFGIPVAPGSATTLGLRLQAHLQPNTAVHAVTLASDFQINAIPPDGYRLEFFAWQNHANLTIPPPGAAGQTHYLTSGIGHDGVANNFAGNIGPTGMTPETGSGAWFAATGDEGALRDFVAFKNGTEQLASLFPNPYVQGTQNGREFPFNLIFPRILIGSINGGALATAQGLDPSAFTPAGSLGFAWHHWQVDVFDNTATWSVDGFPIARLVDGENGNVPLTGSISLGYMDIFNSATGLPNLHFAIIDNLTVTVIPEPAALALLVASVLLVRTRRSLQIS